MYFVNTSEVTLNEMVKGVGISEAVTSFWSGADSERSEPKIFATPLQGGGKFYRGLATINPLTYKHRADI